MIRLHIRFLKTEFAKLCLNSELEGQVLLDCRRAIFLKLFHLQRIDNCQWVEHRLYFNRLHKRSLMMFQPG